MLKTSSHAKRLRWTLLLLALLLGGQAAWMWVHQHTPENRPLYIYSWPSGAEVIVTSLKPSGPINVSLGQTPGPLPVENPAAALAFVIRLAGYHDQPISGKLMKHDTVRYPPTGYLTLRPRIPVLVPFTYFLLRQPFLAALACWPLFFYLVVLGPLRRSEDQDTVQQGLFILGKVEPGSRIERYTVVRKLGEGGMATVFEVGSSDVADSTRLALKLLKPELAREVDRQRFRAEASLLRDFQHPHLVAFYDHGEHLGLPFLVMELLRGESLSLRLAERSTWVEKTTYFRQIAQALLYLHEKGLVHRDIKPSNVFVTQQGKAVVMDLGIARLALDSPLRAQTQNPMPSVVGEVMGTPGFMSPEQMSGQPTDWRSDIYSLALLIAEVISGEPPFGRGHPAEILARQAMQPIPPLPPTPDDQLQDCLLRWLDPDPRRRATHMNEVASALQEISERALRNSAAEA